MTDKAGSMNKIRRAINLGLTFLLVNIGLVILLIFLVIGAQRKLVELGELRHQSHVLANQLRQSSDELTRLIRTYAATGNLRFKRQFRDVLAIRNGTLPRPKKYERIYWDFLGVEGGQAPYQNGAPASLVDLMKQAGFSPTEMALLTLAKEKSDQLITLEHTAMALVDRANKEQALDNLDRQEALQILFGEEYHKAKIEIMRPINQFFEELNKRTHAAVVIQEYRSKLLLYTLVFLFILSITVILLLFRLGRKYHLQMIDELTQTVEERTAELKDLVATKDKLFSIIAHDLRGPLGSVTSCMEEMLEGVDRMTTDELREMLVSLDVSVSSTYALMENLLMWAKLQTGRISSEYAPVAIAGIIKNAVAAQLSIARLKEIRIDIEIDPELEASVDVAQMGLVVRNLVSNAVKFSYRGGNITIAAEKVGEYLQISVQDHGTGIKREHLDSLFQTNSNYHRTGTEQEPSSGLGLSLVNEVVQASGGELHVESTETEGSLFRFTLPVH